MKRLFGLSVVALFVLGLSASHLVYSAPSPKASKVVVCHVDVDEETGEETTEVIEISDNGNAVDAHLENHGDCIISVGALPDDERDVLGTECDATDDDDDDACDA